MHLTVCSCRVTYAFQSESTLYTCLNVKELLAPNSPKIWRFSECNWTRTHNHLVRKRTLNYSAKMAKLLSWVVSIYLYGALDCMFLSCHLRVSEWIHALYWPKCQGNPCLKQARNLKFRWVQLDSNTEPVSWKTNTQPFSQIECQGTPFSKQAQNLQFK